MKKQTVRIAVVDDSTSICEMLKIELGAVSDFEVVTVVDDPTTAIGSILQTKPNILLLDLVMPGIDGEEILEELRRTMQLDFKMKIIIISSISNENTISRCMKLGADYYLLKPLSKDMLIKKIRQLSTDICDNGYMSMDSIAVGSINTTSSKSYNNEMLNSKITKFLLAVGVNPKLKGFYFLKDSICYIYMSGNELSSVTKIVYPKVAKMYETEGERVERSIRTAIEKAFTKEGGGEFYFKSVDSAYRTEKGRRYPSNREFIFTSAEYIKNNP